jgi:hypothetical protein
MLFRIKFMLVMFCVLFVLVLGADWLWFFDELTVLNELQCAAAGSIIVAKLFFMGGVGDVAASAQGN